MGRVKYQQVTIRLPAATYNRLAQATLNKRRVTDLAVEKIRVAISELFPSRTPEEWKDRSRMEGAWRYQLLLWYDLLCYLLHKWTGREVNQEKQVMPDSGQFLHLTLKIPGGLMKWVEEIARSRRLTIREATVYAVEYGIHVLDSQGSPEELEHMMWQMWREIWRAIWSRS